MISFIEQGYKEGTLPIVYEEDEIIVFLDPKPVSPGHMVVAPKQKYTILEEIPDWLMGRMGEIANKASTAAFETMGAKGTNIIVHNGIPAGQDNNHFVINVIPRFDNDGQDLFWAPKQLSEEEMSTIELSLKPQTDIVGEFEKKKPKDIPIEDDIPDPEELDEGENYMLKQLDRIP
ncbi:MAG: HIT family protein [Nanoarchaeota archaeon]